MKEVKLINKAIIKYVLIIVYILGCLFIMYKFHGVMQKVAEQNCIVNDINTKAYCDMLGRGK